MLAWFVQTTAAGGVSWEAVEQQTAAAPKEKKKKKQMTVKVPKWCGKWVVGMDDFKEGVVGAKSKNIAGTATVHCAICHMRIAAMTAGASLAALGWQFCCAEMHDSCLMTTSDQLSFSAMIKPCMCIPILR